MSIRNLATLAFLAALPVAFHATPYDGTQGLSGFRGNHTPLLTNTDYKVTGNDNGVTILNLDDYAGLCTYADKSPFVISVAANGTSLLSSQLRHVTFCDRRASNATYTITVTGLDANGVTTYTDTFGFVASSAETEGFWINPGMANYGRQLKSFTVTVTSTANMRSFRFSSFTTARSFAPRAAALAMTDAATGAADSSSVDAGASPSATAPGIGTSVSGSSGATPAAADSAAGSVRPTARLIASSARGNAVAGENLLAGFVISGSQPKTVLVRAVGPSLADFGVQDVLATPGLRVLRGATVVAETSTWQPGLATEFNRLGAFPLHAGSHDAAIETTLAAGAYNVQLLDGGNQGIALLEIYDASANSNANNPRLINISSRGHVGPGADTLTGGFAVTGDQPKQVLIRAIGPGLADYGISGAVADPVLRVYDAKSNLLARNDNWEATSELPAGQTPGSAATIAAAAKTVGAFELKPGSKDAALILSVSAGAYTATVSTADNTGTGVALIEIYELP